MSAKYITPNIRLLNKGIVKCGFCGIRYDLAMHNRLELFKCQKCETLILNPLKIGRYWLYQPLGAGGVGSVYKAIDRWGRKEYAVKVLPRRKLHGDRMDSLLQEGEVGKKLGRHPNLVRTVAYGQIGEERYLVAEFVIGDRLDNLVKTNGPFPEKLALTIIYQVLKAEMYILKRGYLFRDLKPQNIIITHDGTVKLFDYGLCMPFEQANTPNNSDEMEGSPLYLPPERILGDPEDEYSEIYSIGMVLFYMLTGRTYYGETKKAIDAVMRHLNAVRISSVKYSLEHCHPKTAAMLDRMVARNPNERIRNFKILKRALKKIIKMVNQRDHEKGFHQITYDQYSGHYPIELGYAKMVYIGLSLSITIIIITFFLVQYLLNNFQFRFFLGFIRDMLLF